MSTENTSSSRRSVSSVSSNESASALGSAGVAAGFREQPEIGRHSSNSAVNSAANLFIRPS